jgi:hypothetical protein
VAPFLACVQFEDELGACERILKTPFPYGYVVHLRTFMLLWLLSLPFALVEVAGWLTIPICIAVAYALLGIESIAVEIENPFGHDYNDLPLATICQTIESNCYELLGRRIQHQHNLAERTHSLWQRASQEHARSLGSAVSAALFCAAIAKVLEVDESRVTAKLVRLAASVAGSRARTDCEGIRLLSEGAAGSAAQTLRVDSPAEFAELCLLLREFTLEPHQIGTTG